MAQSKCPKCDATQFEVKIIKPELSKFDIALVQCAKCGSVVGSLESSNLGARLANVEKILAATSDLLNQVHLKLVAMQTR